MKKAIISILILIAAIPAIAFEIHAGDQDTSALHVDIPDNVNTLYLLSPGTLPVLDFMRSSFDLQLAELEKRFQTKKLEAETKDAAGTLETATKNYDKAVSDLRNHYISKIEIDILSAESQISPESSALGEISFTFSAKNTSDTIISDIIYLPSINEIPMPTTSKLVLELIDPSTLKLGIPPGGAISNKGHDPEKFAFFIGELKAEQVEAIRKHIDKTFSLKILDLHFAWTVDYKGQSQEMDIETAFVSRLMPLKKIVKTSSRDLEKKKLAFEKASSEYASRKQASAEEFKKSAENLRQSSIRYKTERGHRHKFNFEDIEPGTYILFAEDYSGKVVMDQVEISPGKNEISATTGKRNPFEP